jgi:hypothetical protein
MVLENQETSSFRAAQRAEESLSSFKFKERGISHPQERVRNDGGFRSSGAWEAQGH